MLKCVQEALRNQGESYILPFLWVHGENMDTVLREIEQIADCGIREFCVESRPHPDFLRQSWWELMDRIMEKAEQKGMRVWLLDDQHFPTGYAAGAYRKQPEKAKVYLKEFHIDLYGPAEELTVFPEAALEAPEEFLGLWVYRRETSDSANLVMDSARNVAGGYRNGRLRLTLPDGMFRLVLLYTSRTGGGNEFYMNLPDEESVGVLIDTVYEPHYQHYKDAFGKTFAGFFSDEPELGNTKGYEYHMLPGTEGKVYPWSDSVWQELKVRWGADAAKYLPALWFDVGKKTAGLRYDYMDVLTGQIKRCFSEKIGEWCRNHRVEYIGHIIEDNNAHGRLGCSTGHYFRAQAGQDMSGIDVVSQQLMPGHCGRVHRWVNGEEDGEFFHFGLAKLGSSGAAVDARKKGRAMCELFGAYGWGEGISLMKWIADHMLVQGINVFVPHAFSPIFTDLDCPPHFYGQGQNPQFRFFGRLMRYLNRAAHLLQHGVRRTEAAVLYPVEAEWSQGTAMPAQKPMRELLEHQLDGNILPADVLSEVQFQEGFFYFNGYTYSVFLLPEMSAILDAAEKFVIKAAKYHIPVFAVNTVPAMNVYGEPLSEKFFQSVTVLPLNEVGESVRKLCSCSVTPAKKVPGLRACYYQQEDGVVCMFLNEDVRTFVHTAVTIYDPGSEKHDSETWMLYRPMINTLETLKTNTEVFESPVYRGDEDNTVLLNLAPGETVFLVKAFRKRLLEIREEVKQNTSGVQMGNWEIREQSLLIEWTIAKARAYPEFEACGRLLAGQPLPDLNGETWFPDFTGTFRYDGSFYLKREDLWQMQILYFPQISECAEVWINGEHAGDLLENRNSIDVTGLLREDENRIRVEVTNTLVWQLKDKKSSYMQVPPTGMTKPPVLKCCRFKKPK